MPDANPLSRLRSGKIGQRLKEPLRAIVERGGYDLVPLEREENDILAAALRRHRIDLAVDVGANQGQYSRRLRTLGYTGRIRSLEPGRDAFDLLRRRAQDDPRWDVENLALGASSDQLELQVSENSVSSSLLAVGERHVQAAPDSRTVRTETVRVEPLDALEVGGDRLLLKVDTQGYELPVLLGASATLPRCRLLQLEVSLGHLYTGQTDYVDLLGHVRDLGFDVLNLLPGFRDADSGQLLQFDLLAERPGAG